MINVEIAKNDQNAAPSCAYILALDQKGTINACVVGQ